MQVVFNAINTVQVTVLVFYDPCNVCIELISMISLNCWLTTLCSEHNVIEKLTIT
jgi:hypothetical protein